MDMTMKTSQREVLDCEPPSASYQSGLSIHLCERFFQWRPSSIPPEVTHTSKLFVIDTLGVIAAARRAEGMPILRDRFAKWDATGRSSSLIGKQACSPLTAALLNGAAAHALDFDDQHDLGRVHAYCVSLPAVLATAQEVGHVKGSEFLCALITGIEFHARLGLVCHRGIRHGWHPTTTLGALAGAVACGKVLNLDSAKLLNALGIAFHQAAGTQQSLYDNVLSKRLGPGFAARAAVLSAFLAFDGLTGPWRPLEGDAGLFKVFEHDEVEIDHLTNGLEDDWELLNYSIKPYPSCRCNHSIIDLGIQAHAAGVVPANVESIRIFVSRVNMQAIGGMYLPSKESIVHAQFNGAFSLARSLIDGRFDLRSFGKEKLIEPSLIELARRISVLEDPNVPVDAINPVRIEIETRDGRKSVITKATLKGSTEEPLSESEIFAKFKRNLNFGFDAPDAVADRLADVVMCLETSTDAGNDIAQAFPTALIDQ